MQCPSSTNGSSTHRKSSPAVRYEKIFCCCYCYQQVKTTPYSQVEKTTLESPDFDFALCISERSCALWRSLRRTELSVSQNAWKEPFPSRSTFRVEPSSHPTDLLFSLPPTVSAFQKLFSKHFSCISQVDKTIYFFGAGRAIVFGSFYSPLQQKICWWCIFWKVFSPHFFAASCKIFIHIFMLGSSSSSILNHFEVLSPICYTCLSPPHTSPLHISSSSLPSMTAGCEAAGANE